MVLEVWSSIISSIWEFLLEMQIIGSSTPDLLDHKFWQWGPAVCPLGVADALAKV